MPTPSQYAKIANTQKYIKGAWNDKSVRFILQNEVYIGNTIQNKRKKVNYKINKQIEIPKSQWIKVENTHEPIISKQDFEMAQEMLKRHSYKHKNITNGQTQGLPLQKHKEKNHLLSGLLYCGNCKAPMTFIPTYKKRGYYICCSTTKRYKKELNLCQMKLIKETEIEEKVINILKQITQKYINKNRFETEICRGRTPGRPDYEKFLKTLQTKITDLQKVNLNLYKDKVKEIIAEKQFLELLEETNKEKEKYILQIQEINKKIEESKEQEKSDSILKNVVDKILNYEDVDANLVGLLIDKIIINLDGTIEINFKFKQNKCYYSLVKQ